MQKSLKGDMHDLVLLSKGVVGSNLAKRLLCAGAVDTSSSFPGDRYVRHASPDEILGAAVNYLEFDRGDLLRAAKKPTEETQKEWLEKGDWLALAASVEAEKVFFVEQHPVAVFARTDSSDPAVLREVYNRIWCMARPQLLFLASPGELTILDLEQPPVQSGEALDGHGRVLARAHTLTEVHARLRDFHRERIETGAIFGDGRFGDGACRADRALIRDLKRVRASLHALPVAPDRLAPEVRHLHALIGRAIFVRYLEDRGIITCEYFETVAKRRKDWGRLLETSDVRPGLDSVSAGRCFLDVLRNKDFTYALFAALADDFNGDTFPLEEDEQERIGQAHLSQLRLFLLGENDGQQNLFFQAYRFELIPIELISTIYEEFYNQKVGDALNQGSHYTPPALVEFVLNQTLTAEVLATRPRVLDPACGSGIFLVEAFRRMVRHQWAAQGGRRLSRAQLLKILGEQIAGIDINEEAVRVAAFSLCLAFLHYQHPREINADRRLPHLKWQPKAVREKRAAKKPGVRFFPVLLCANAFAVETLPDEVREAFGTGSVSVVVGNPPWGDPKSPDADAVQAKAATHAWCKTRGRSVGDKELSQAFIHLALDLLALGGRAGLLVSSGVLFKDHDNSRAFRRQWLETVQLRQVVNFAHVRHLFFSDGHRETAAISPFLSVIFDRLPKPDGEAADSDRFAYWSAKRSAMVEGTRSVILSRGDMHWLSQADCLANEDLWKIYWWGGHRDHGLVRMLQAQEKLSQIRSKTADPIFGRGFLKGDQSCPAEWLSNYRELPSECLTKYGQIRLGDLVAVPAKVERRGIESIYSGKRLLIGRGIKSSGEIVARLETRKFCFRHSIYGIRLQGLEDWQEAMLVAVFWSSLARYYFWMTSGSWGFWHYEIHLEDVRNMPIAFPSDAKQRERIVRIVTELRGLDLEPDGLALGGLSAARRLPELERELDEAVFDVYGLRESERDLVRDMCSVGLDLFYRRNRSDAVLPVVVPPMAFGLACDVPEAEEGLSAYLRVFLDLWNDELAPDGELAWEVLSPPSGAPIQGLRFFTRYKRDRGGISRSAVAAGSSWGSLLESLNRLALVSAGSTRIWTDTFYRYVGEREIVVLKRNERRFWTRSAAREDAEALMVYRMNETEDSAS